MLFRTFRSAAWRSLALLASASCAQITGTPSPARDERADLRRVIDSMLSSPDTRNARWGVLIVDPDRGDTLYSRDAGKLFIPASNQKILTSSLALETLGPDYRWSTPVLAGGPVRDGVLEGDLLIEGRGDPSVTDSIAGDAMLPLLAIADSLALRGVRAIRGRVLPFRDAFPDATIGFGWSWDDLDEVYGAAFDELFFNDGVAELLVTAGRAPGDSVAVRVRPAKTFPKVRVIATTTVRGTGRDSLSQVLASKDTLRGDFVVSGTIPAGDSTLLAVTFRDSREAYVNALAEALAVRGITVMDSILPAATSGDTLLVLKSPPLPRVLAAFMKPSQNQLGEMILKTVALMKTDTGTARVGRRLMAEHLVTLGAAPDGFLVWDGSGLSRRDMVSPETVVRVLSAARRSPSFQSFFDAMPVAGVDGTLRTRMRGTPAEANVRAKTGTLGNVRSLSGYVTTRGGGQLIFSVLSNNFLTSTAYVSRVQDSIAVRLTRLSIRSAR